MSKNKNFVVVHDKNAKEELEDAGFIMVEDKEGAWKFANIGDSKMEFSENVSDANVSYTNKLTF